MTEQNHTGDDAQSMWMPIETAPRDEYLLLGWWQEWPERRWEMAAGLAGSTRGGWLHGQATHWQRLPGPPAAAQPPAAPVTDTASRIDRDYTHSRLSADSAKLNEVLELIEYQRRRYQDVRLNFNQMDLLLSYVQPQTVEVMARESDAEMARLTGIIFDLVKALEWYAKDYDHALGCSQWDGGARARAALALSRPESK